MYTYFFATANIVTRTPLNVRFTLMLPFLFYVCNTTEQAVLENLIVAQHVKKICYSVDTGPSAVHNLDQSTAAHVLTLSVF
jgi:hypothetical protein